MGKGIPKNATPTHLVQMLEGQNDFANVDAHFLLGEVLPLVQMGEQLAAAHVVCKKTRKNSISKIFYKKISFMLKYFFVRSTCCIF